MPKLVYVVMANDSVDCVFSDEYLAEAYVERQKAYQKELLADHSSPLLYYRFYEVTLDETGHWGYRRGRNNYTEQAPPEKRGRRADGLDAEVEE